MGDRVDSSGMHVACEEAHVVDLRAVFVMTEWPVDWDDWPTGSSSIIGVTTDEAAATAWAREHRNGYCRRSERVVLDA